MLLILVMLAILVYHIDPLLHDRERSNRSPPGPYAGGKYSVNSYPTLKYFPDATSDPDAYEQARTKKALKNFAVRKVRRHSSPPICNCLGGWSC